MFSCQSDTAIHVFGFFSKNMIRTKYIKLLDKLKNYFSKRSYDQAIWRRDIIKVKQHNFREQGRFNLTYQLILYHIILESVLQGKIHLVCTQSFPKNWFLPPPLISYNLSIFPSHFHSKPHFLIRKFYKR